MKKEYASIYQKFIDEFGIESQMMMCIEEMSELTKELCKYFRYKNTDKISQVEDNIVEELADVINMAEQLTYYFGEDKVNNVRDQKLKRSENFFS